MVLRYLSYCHEFLRRNIAICIDYYFSFLSDWHIFNFSKFLGFFLSWNFYFPNFWNCFLLKWQFHFPEFHRIFAFGLIFIFQGFWYICYWHDNNLSKFLRFLFFIEKTLIFLKFWDYHFQIISKFSFIYFYPGRYSIILGRVFVNIPGDRCPISGRVIPKTQKVVLDTSLLNTQHYKVRFKGKEEQTRERSSVLPYTSVYQLLKRKLSGSPRLRSSILLTSSKKYLSLYMFAVLYGRLTTLILK